MRDSAIISADVVSSTALPLEGLKELQKVIRDYIDKIEARNVDGLRFWGRIVRGDSVEIFVRNPREVLRIALQLKTLVMLFNPAGLRVAIGIGEMREVNLKLDMMDGEAIYRAGRLLNKMSNHTKSGVKALFAADCSNPLLSEQLNVTMRLVDVILNKVTPRQCEVLHYKLMGLMDFEIAEKLGISPSAVSQHKSAIGWDAMENMLNYYEETL